MKNAESVSKSIQIYGKIDSIMEAKLKVSAEDIHTVSNNKLS